MRLDSKVYSEAQMAARMPRFKYLMVGLVCGAVVPTMYARHYNLPHFDFQTMKEEMKVLPRQEQNVPQVTHIRHGLAPIEDEDADTYLLMSSIM
ncbi:Spg1p KNAG_0A01520 [Huiozyma naganishii CBS 8797]|uniref:Uncharacterized protein n=1 Tax=Huiozyma naganishii (strain ATCC MYA-139 / BCRC 22969 / CBS 8797 / KCTC 17520 / NBRC 10181 / NCYC 3082 / Yp74L-3) TaxID=1071383 RepID=J7S378_HUIN7|nr:hypothetical protein KNAG_0A01520 [Kazachstania naganishii CBS 8797]CCK67841.1 hypothetical protein KNAG_0A01520 [Kazachstania naganishii CBS 8797]